MAVNQLDPVRTPADLTTPTRWWWLVLVGGVLGIIGTIWQTAERMATLAGGGGKPICEINSVVSCETVYGYW